MKHPLDFQTHDWVKVKPTDEKQFKVITDNIENQIRRLAQLPHPCTNNINDNQLELFKDQIKEH